MPDAPAEFISLPVRGRFLRVRPGAISYLQVDANNNTVVHLIGGEVLVATVPPDEVEALISGAPPKAAVHARSKARAA